MVGFNAKNKDDLHPSYRCPSCHLLLREPCQLSCGHRQCETCTNNSEGEIVKCAECSEGTPKNEIMPDRGCRNDMKQLQIRCLLCEWDGLFKDYEEHLNQAHPNRICEFCGTTFGTTIELDEHKHKECTKMAVPCAFTEPGRSDSVYRNQSSHDHCIFRPSIMPNSTDHLRCATSNIQNENLSEMEIDVGQTVPSSIVVSTSANNSAKIQEISELINILAAEYQSLNEEIQRLVHVNIRLRNLVELVIIELSTLASNHQAQESLRNGIQMNQGILQQELASLTQQLRDMEFASYDGISIWKITNVRQTMTDAESERRTSIYSPPFYSSPGGYKMCARLFLNGDETVRRTHMSLRFVLMRGPNDAILTFPFNFKIIFCLYDQTPSQRHIVDFLHPDITSDSFQRPQLGMNIDSGISQFFPLAEIRQEGNPYVRDDTMFIKIMIDPNNMPEDLLWYALNINPGVPMLTQQMMIEQEAERRLQQQ